MKKVQVDSKAPCEEKPSKLSVFNKVNINVGEHEHKEEGQHTKISHNQTLADDCFALAKRLFNCFMR